MDVYTWGTPNGHKVHIMLEECGAQYRIVPIDINDQAALSDELPQQVGNKKIPILVDTDASGNQEIPIAESGAILIYLAEKYSRFLSPDPTERYAAMQWLMFQMSTVGPMMGQFSHFKKRTEADSPYALQRFQHEVQRIHRVMNEHLAIHAYFAGTEYSIADMAIFPWLRISDRLGLPLSEYPHLQQWYETLMQRPAIQRALALNFFSPAVTE